MGSVLDVLAGYNPSGMAARNQGQNLENQQRAAQIPLVQVEAQKAQGEAQMQQIAMRDQQILGQAFREAAGDPNKTFLSAVRGGISPSAAMAFKQNDAKLQQEYATLAKTKTDTGKTALEVEMENEKRVGAGYSTLLDIQDKAKRAEAAPDILAHIQSVDPSHPALTLAQVLDDDALKAQIGKNNYATTRGAQILQRADIAAKEQATKSGAQATALKGTEAARQDLTTVNDPSTYAQWRAAHPEYPAPGIYSPDWVRLNKLAGVPLEKQPEVQRQEQGIFGTDAYSQFLPAFAASLHKTPAQLTPPEKIASFAAFKEANQDPELKASMLANRASIEGMRAIQEQNALAQRGDQSYRFHAAELDKVAKPVADLQSRIGGLQDMLAQNSPQADALVGPKLLTVLVGGQGSGVRVNNAEIERTVGGKSKWQALEGAINQWNLDPTKAGTILPEQRKQIRALVQLVADKTNAKESAIRDARTRLTTSNDPMEHRKILTDVQQKVADAEKTPTTSAPAATHRFNLSTGKIEPIQ